MVQHHFFHILLVEVAMRLVIPLLGQGVTKYYKMQGSLSVAASLEILQPLRNKEQF